MPLPGKVQPAPPGALGFDADRHISAHVAQQFTGQGYRFCVRYLSRGPVQAARDLSAAEGEAILGAGLALMAVQHVRKAGWSPAEAMGKNDGANAALNATAIGFPPGVNVWCDLEGVNQATVAQDVIDYCKAWHAAVSAAGFVPGLYVGANAILTGQQLYDLPFKHYWKSESKVPAIPVRGYQMIQTQVPQPVNGIGIDKDVTQTDLQGGQALWLAV
jgi:hypothetical protein